MWTGLILGTKGDRSQLLAPSRPRSASTCALGVLCDTQGRSDRCNLCDLHLLSPPLVGDLSGSLPRRPRHLSCGLGLDRKSHKLSGSFPLSMPPHPITAQREPIPAQTRADRDRPLPARALAVLGNTQGRADLHNLCDPHLLSPPSVVGPARTAGEGELC